LILATSFRTGERDPMTSNRKHVRGLLTTSVGTIAFLVAASSSAPFAAGNLNLRGTLRIVSKGVVCPAGQPDATACRARSAEALVSGLGSVSVTYTWSYRMGPPTCPADVGKPLATTGRLVVVGKGEIHFALAEGARCIDEEPMRNEPQDFTITGGTGSYQGASGSGIVERALGAGVGTETWTGTLDVPGLEFDVTPPTLSGATSKTVRVPRGAKRVRVNYAVSARDDVNGAVPVSCSPRSGSRFPIGRTVVTCAASDTSGNTGTAKFLITVKKGR
jgi:HYR domain